MIVFVLILWYLIGFVGSLMVEYYDFGHVTTKDLILHGIFGVLGLIWLIITFLISDLGGEPIFKNKNKL